MGVTKTDWKLFREKISVWQERYMDRLIEEYKEILNRDSASSEKFWILEQKIRQDKKNPGVRIELDKAEMSWQVFQMYVEGTVTDEDLKDFSEEFRSEIDRMVKMVKR